jgi:hypothetical protein
MKRILFARGTFKKRKLVMKKAVPTTTAIIKSFAVRAISF